MMVSMFARNKHRTLHRKFEAHRGGDKKVQAEGSR
jgi:hypothetical protein